MRESVGGITSPTIREVLEGLRHRPLGKRRGGGGDGGGWEYFITQGFSE